MTVSSLQRCCDGRRISPLEARVQPIQAYPLSCTQDLRVQLRYIPSRFPAFLPCSFPLWVSPPGRVGVLEGPFALNLLLLWSDLTCAEAAHHNFRDGI